MKTSTKVAIGISVAAVATITTGAILSGKVLEKIGHVKKRRQIKGFVEDYLGGNDKILNIVDDLSEKDVDHIIDIVDKVKDGKKQISVYGDRMKNTTQDVKNRLMSFVEDIID